MERQLSPSLIQTKSDRLPINPSISVVVLTRLPDHPMKRIAELPTSCLENRARDRLSRDHAACRCRLIKLATTGNDLRGGFNLMAARGVLASDAS